MKLTVTVGLGNEAMQSASDASHAIQKALANGGGIGMFEPLVVGARGGILDGNGNVVGKWEVTE